VNLALPALVLFLGILPGVCCFYAYFAGRFEKRAVGVSASEELALYVVFAVPLNVIAWRLFELRGLAFDFGIATHLIAGNISDGPVHAEIATFFQRFWFLNAWTYFVLLAASYLVGSAARRVVWASRLDLRIPYLRVRHEWFYVLHGRVRGLPKDVISYADVMTRLPDTDGSQTRLFRGVVLDFQISPTGGIETLALGDAKRGKSRETAFHWKPIPSDRLVIMGRDIHSINVTYFSIDDPDDVASFRDRLRSWWRSFWFEQPQAG
jgi:hypothetical protein